MKFLCYAFSSTPTYDLYDGYNVLFDGENTLLFNKVIVNAKCTAISNDGNFSPPGNKTLTLDKKGGGEVTVQKFRIDASDNYINKVIINDTGTTGKSTILMTDQDGSPLNRTFEVENNSFADVYIENVSTSYNPLPDTPVNTILSGSEKEIFYIDNATVSISISYNGPLDGVIFFSDGTIKSTNNKNIFISFEDKAFNGTIDIKNAIGRGYYIFNLGDDNSNIVNITGDEGSFTIVCSGCDKTKIERLINFTVSKGTLGYQLI